jgi:hypothetical protein
MKIKLSSLLAKKEALIQLVNKQLPVRASFKLGKTVRLINTELSEYEKVRTDLVKKYGKETENGDFTVIKDTPEMKSFQEELSQILDEEIEIDIQPISLSDLGEEITIESSHMSELIDFVITE